MNYSFMSFSTPKLSLAEMLEAARKFGYDGIEPRLDEGHKHGIEVAATAADREKAFKMAKDTGISICCLATSLTFSDPAKKDAMIRQCLERIDLACDVGARTLRVFGGKLAAGLTREAAIILAADSLASVADHAAEKAVTLCVETHDDWCNPSHVLAVLRRVDHPAVGANWDIMHPVRTKNASIEESFQKLRPWIKHLHIHDCDEAGKLVPIGEGIIDHRRAIHLLKSNNYGGFISGEWIGWEPWEKHLPREIATLKGYEEEAS
ncbi:MAG TPA: sugar phosphate isomerase/epimerase family protein [Candidatus Brocadiia bacterium]|nr:sugar phosphate isomerase/epimerase family protein [Candidatus Brocadiia bacterium]